MIMSVPGRKYTAYLAVGLVLLFMGCGKGTQPAGSGALDIIQMSGRTMGTTFMVKVIKPPALKDTPNSQLTNDIAAGIEDVLKTVNKQMSIWIEDSEISRFNRYGETGWFDVSRDTAAVFARANEVSQLSGGAFDVTMGPLINLWGFGPLKQERQIPHDEKIKEIMEKTGYQKLLVRQAPPALKKAHPQLQTSLAAIAKGFGVDKTGEYLESQGFMHYLVEIGGEVRARGLKEKDRPWRIAIASPGSGTSYQKVLYLENTSMATSGDYFNYFEKDGVRYSHTIDPTTGKPITHTLASVTVVHPSCTYADAMATAINVMGPEKGYELAVKENLAVFLIIRSGNGFVEEMTPQFKELLGE